MKKITLLILLAGLCFSWVKSQTETVLIERHLQESKRLLDSARYESGLERAETARKLLTGFAEGEGDSLKLAARMLAGKALYYLGRYEEAIGHLQNAWRSSKSLVMPAPELRLSTAHFLYRAYADGGFDLLGRPYLDTVLAESTTWREVGELATIHEDLGYQYGEEFAVSAARRHFQLATQIRARRAPYEEYRDLINIGAVARAEGKSKEALEAYLQALAIGRDNVLNPVELGGIYFLTGMAYLEGLDYVRAEEYMQSGLDLTRSRLPALHPVVMKIQDGMGLYYRKSGQTEKGIALYRQLIDSLERDPIQGLLLATLYHNIHLLYLDVKPEPDLETAGRYLERAIRLIDKFVAYSREAQRLHYEALNSKANWYFYRNELPQAIRMYENQLESGEEWFGPNHTNLVLSLNNKGLTEGAASNYAAADQSYARCYAILGIAEEDERPFARLRYVAGAVSVIWNRAENLFASYRAERDVETLKKAIDQYELYVDFIDYLRVGYHEEETRLTQAAENRIVFERLMLCWGILFDRTGDISTLRRSFEMGERSRSLILMDAFRAQEIPDSLLPARLLQEEADWKERLRRLDDRLFIAQNVERSGPAQEKQLQDSLLAAKRAYYDFIQSIEDQFPAYYEYRYGVETVSTTDLQKELARENQSLVEYFVGNRFHSVYIVTPDTVVSQVFTLSYDLNEMCTRFRESITGYWEDFNRDPKVRAQYTTLYDTIAYTLYRDLFEPLEPFLTRNVIIVPDQSLGLTPFGAFLKNLPEQSGGFADYPFLVKDYVFSHAFSATAWRNMRNRTRRSASLSAPWMGFAPAYEGLDLEPALRGGGEGQLRYPALPYSERSVKNIQAIMGGESVTGEAATRALFVSRRHQAGILHLSVHASLHELRNELSHLVFYDGAGATKDVLLYLRDIYGLSMPAEMVVLPACQTAVGRDQSGEGIVNLGRAFAYAGARSIIASLWSVNDESTGALMLAFYEDLWEHSRREALQKAMIRLMELREDWAAPFFWAPFVGYGDMRRLD